MGNAPVQTSNETCKIINGREQKNAYLSPYSPGLNPIK